MAAMKTKMVSYFKENFLFDLKAGFITAVVALPLAIAFAIASGVPPIMGLYTAVIAGILGSGLGGSKFSITGPTGAMTVIILSTVNRFGMEGLLLAGFLAGLFQIGFGLIKLGKLVKFIPFPIISGFTAGIGAIIFIGQIPNALGLVIAPQEHIWETLREIIFHFKDLNFIASGITLSTILLLLFLPKIFSRVRYLQAVPPSMLALTIFTMAVFFFSLSTPVVGEIPSGLPHFNLINLNWDLVHAVLPAAFTIALLGVIEALLCAVVCDGMSNTKHKSDKELISQGVSNAILPFFSGIPCTAAVARSAVNIREGAKTRFAGIIHGLFLLLILLFFGPIAYFIPKAFLAGILIVVSSKMINIQEFRTIIKLSHYDTAVLFITFGMTVLTDLVLAVQIGMVLAIFLIFIRLTNAFNISYMEEYPVQNGLNSVIYRNPKLKDIVSLYSIHGPFFFGAMNVFDHKLNGHIQISKPIILFRMQHVSFIDRTALTRLNSFLHERQKHNGIVFIADLQPQVKETLLRDKEFMKLIRNTALPGQPGIFEKTKDALKFVEDHFTTKKN